MWVSPMLDEQSDAASLQLEEFVPFRLNRLAEAVSRQLSEIYRDRFALEIPEWRVLVTLGQAGRCTAQQIAASTRMHKTRVSRAVAAMQERRLLTRSSNTRDGREVPLCLSRSGRRMYAALVPLARERERDLLSCMPAPQRRAFLVALTVLERSLAIASRE